MYITWPSIIGTHRAAQLILATARYRLKKEFSNRMMGRFRADGLGWLFGLHGAINLLIH